MSNTSFERGGLLKVQRYRISELPSSARLLDLIPEATSSDALKSAARVVAAFYGVPTAWVEAGATAMGKIRVAGEERRFNIRPPKGERICAVRIAEWTDAIGRGALGIRLSQNRIAHMLWLQPRRPFSGRSSLDITVEYVTAPEADYERLFAEGRCLPKSSLIFDANWYPGGRRHVKKRVSGWPLPGAKSPIAA